MRDPRDKRDGGEVCASPPGAPGGGVHTGVQVRHTAAQKLFLLDMGLRSGLPLKEFAPLVGLSTHTSPSLCFV